MTIRYLDEVSGSEDDNMDIVVEVEGRSYLFVAFTPKNILSLMSEGEYSNDKSWVVDGMIIVKFLNEECIENAVKCVVEKGIEKFGVLQHQDENE